MMAGAPYYQAAPPFNFFSRPLDRFLGRYYEQEKNHTPHGA